MKQTHRSFTQSFLYDFAVDGGALGTIATGVGCQVSGIQLPKFSHIYAASILIMSTITSAANNAKVSLGNINNAILTNFISLGGLPLAAKSLNITITAIVPTSATNLNIILAVTTEALTAGKFIVFLSYYAPVASLT